MSGARQYAFSVGEAFENDLDAYEGFCWEWVQYPISRLIAPNRALQFSAPFSPDNWQSFWENEEEEDGRPDMRHEFWIDHTQFPPIAVVEPTPGVFDLGDGWHRVALSVMYGIEYLPAALGYSCHLAPYYSHLVRIPQP